MRWLRVVAAVLALSLMIGELWRSWGAGRHPLFILDDQVMGGFLLAAAWAMRVDTRRNRAAFAGAWGTCAGMLYGSFFGKLVEPASTNPGNWDPRRAHRADRRRVRHRPDGAVVQHHAAER
jgi:hypothetical protein